MQKTNVWFMEGAVRGVWGTSTMNTRRAASIPNSMLPQEAHWDSSRGLRIFSYSHISHDAASAAVVAAVTTGAASAFAAAAAAAATAADNEQFVGTSPPLRCIRLSFFQRALHVVRCPGHIGVEEERDEICDQHAKLNGNKGKVDQLRRNPHRPVGL